MDSKYRVEIATAPHDNFSGTSFEKAAAHCAELQPKMYLCIKESVSASQKGIKNMFISIILKLCFQLFVKL
jgi:hypothetical protein